MNAVGIDVSKGKSMIAVMRPFGEVVASPYEIRHTNIELKELAKFLKSLDGETRAVLEYTGRYYEPVIAALHEAGIFVSAVNPLLIKEYGNNSIRKVKTDKADAVKIAKYTLDNWTDLREYTPVESVRSQLKTLNRQYNLYMKSKTAYKNNLIALLDQTYPGANSLFDSPVRRDGSQKWVDFVTKFWHLDCVTRISEKVFIERYQKFCKHNGYNFSTDRAVFIYKQAKELVPTELSNPITKLLITSAAELLKTISKAIEVIRAQMLELAKLLPEYTVVMNMFGVGSSLGPQLMAEIGDITRFAHKQSLAAFAGVDPMPSQSGTHERKSNPASKRGAPHLRRALFLVMTVLMQKAPHDDPVYCFLDKKRSEGKHFYVYMTAGCNKFLRVYYGRVNEYLASLDT